MNPPIDSATNHGSSAVGDASSSSMAADSSGGGCTPSGGTNGASVVVGAVVVVSRGAPVVVVVGATVVSLDEVVVDSSGSVVVVVVVVGSSVDAVVVVVSSGGAVVVVVLVMIWAPAGARSSRSPAAARASATARTQEAAPSRRLPGVVRTAPILARTRGQVHHPSDRWSVMAQVHLAGPLATLERLARLAGELGLDHRSAPGALRLSPEATATLAAMAPTVLAPLEADLVRVVEATSADDDLELVAAAGVAPTLGQLTGRERHRDLLAALDEGSAVHVGFQPVVSLADDRAMGFEALLRVRLRNKDIPPAEVLAAAEEAGRIVEVDAVARAVAAEEAAPLLGQRWLFLNISPASLPVPIDQLGPFALHLGALGISTEQVVLEAPVGPLGVLRRQLAAVFRTAVDLGCKVGLDNVRSERDLDGVDFVPDVVKLDRSLVRGLPGGSASRALGAVVRECQHAASMLVAQGIESGDQLDAVRDLGVRFAQGWHLGRPGRITSEATSFAS